MKQVTVDYPEEYYKKHIKSIIKIQNWFKNKHYITDARLLKLLNNKNQLIITQDKIEYLLNQFGTKELI